MITEGLLNIFFGFLDIILILIPKFSFDFFSAPVALATLVKFLFKANYFVPIDTLLVVFGCIVATKSFKLGVWTVNWIIRRIADIIP